MHEVQIFAVQQLCNLVGLVAGLLLLLHKSSILNSPAVLLMEILPRAWQHIQCCPLGCAVLDIYWEWLPSIISNTSPGFIVRGAEALMTTLREKEETKS